MEKKYYCGKSDAQIPNKVYMTRSVVTGDESGTCFINEEKDICRQIVDPWGNIRNFPGVEPNPVLLQECAAYRYAPLVRYQMAFAPREQGGFLVLWTIRQEYFDPGDDWGFGREEYDEVVLYSILDENGDFSAPFRLYSIGKKKYA